MKEIEQFDKYYTGARTGIDFTLWHLKQLMHAAPSSELETLARQAYFSICAADTVMQVYASYYDVDDDDEDEEIDG